MGHKDGGYQFLGIEMHFWAYWIAGFFTLASNFISFYSIYKHFHYRHSKKTRRHLIRIHLMVNIYALEAWVSLMMPDATLYLNCIRDFWEAVVIYEFYALTLECAGGASQIGIDLHGKTSQIFPMNWCLPAWDVEQLIFWSRFGILQYCLCQVLMSITIFSCDLADVYEEGSMDPKAAYPYVALIITLSQSWAIYCLVLYYHGLMHMDKASPGGQNFARFNGLSKFICVKMVVFFIFWQGCGLAVLVHFGIINSTDEWTESEVAIAIQDCCVCLEMFGFAIAHIYVFDTKDFVETRDVRSLLAAPTLVGAIASGFDVRDLADDTKKYVFQKDDNAFTGGRVLISKVDAESPNLDDSPTEKEPTPDERVFPDALVNS